VTEKEGWAIAG